MKIYHNNNMHIMFKSGLTNQMKKEIEYCDVKKIEAYFSKNNIACDFCQNKVIAWCSLKVLNLITELNKKYGLRLCLPNGIYVEDFNKLNNILPNAIGFTNFAPVKLYKDKNKIINEKTIFFNSSNNQNWNNIDTISDEYYENGTNTTNYFLESFIHEFMHVIHEGNLINVLGGKNLIERLLKMNRQGMLEFFYEKYSYFLSQICDYAVMNPLESVACDLSKTIIKNIDKSKILPTANFIANTPYDSSYIFNSKSDKVLERLLHDFWNGNFHL